jgi:hypothetical protein
MNISGWKKAALAIIVTIVLGAIGSGLWELALRPAALWSGKAILTVVTLGSSTVKDGIYLEAAKGYHEAGDLELFSFEVMCLFGLSGGFAGVIIGSLYVRRVITSAQDTEAAHNKLKSLLDEKGFITKTDYPMMWTLLLVSLLFACIQDISYLKLFQANEAYTYYSQSLTICRPYMDDQQTQIIESRYASIKSRDDYMNVTNQLAQVALANHRELPKFNPW